MLVTSSVSPSLAPMAAMPTAIQHRFTSIESSSNNAATVPDMPQPSSPASTTAVIFPPNKNDETVRVPEAVADHSNAASVPLIRNNENNIRKIPAAAAVVKLPPPPPLPAVNPGRDSYDCGVATMLAPSLVPGHPREGQAASLLGGKYLLLEEIEGASLHRCLHIESNQEFICKVKPLDSACQRLLTAHYRVDGHPNINTIQEVVIGHHRVYLVLPPCHGDLHSYVRSRRRLREASARALFRQVVSAVHHAHTRGIVLRDLKLRKFVFTDESRTELKLESLEDAVVLEDTEDDILSDKHGCPAYVSPEILKSNTQYSGRAADMWGLGVMLYTMLVGRYPFHGAEHSGLFAKIRRGQFSLPEHLSSRAKCLIRCLLKRDPEHRLTTDDVLVHPWLTGSHRERSGCSRLRPPHLETTDHCVPDPVPDTGSGPLAANNVGVDKFDAVFRSAATAPTSAGPSGLNYPH